MKLSDLNKAAVSSMPISTYKSKIIPTSAIAVSCSFPNGNQAKEKVIVEHCFLETIRGITVDSLKAVVKLPEQIESNEWIAANIVDFSNEIYLIFALCQEDADGFSSVMARTSCCFNEKMSVPTSIEQILSWIDMKIAKFPDPGKDRFNEKFPELIKDIFKKFLIIFSIIYNCHSNFLYELDALKQLNTTFKRFIFFGVEFKLLENDFYQLRSLIEVHVNEYCGD